MIESLYKNFNCKKIFFYKAKKEKLLFEIIEY